MQTFVFYLFWAIIFCVWASNSENALIENRRLTKRGKVDTPKQNLTVPRWCLIVLCFFFVYPDILQFDPPCETFSLIIKLPASTSHHSHAHLCYTTIYLIWKVEGVKGKREEAADASLFVPGINCHTWCISGQNEYNFVLLPLKCLNSVLNLNILSVFLMR